MSDMKRSANTSYVSADSTGVQSFGQSPSVTDFSRLQAEDEYLQKLSHHSKLTSEQMTNTQQHIPPGFVLATLPLVTQGVAAIVDDSFTRCFKTKKRVAWNWNVYLLPAWCFGVFVRYCVLFPLRLLCLIMGFLLVGLLFPPVKAIGKVMDTHKWETFLIQLLASAFVASWSGVIRIHGIRPTPRPGQPAGVFVANHSSMIDFIVLLQSHAYAVVGQHHPGWVGFLQDSLLKSLNCIWFNRGQSNDRKYVAQRLREHSHDPSKSDCPLLVFPEGTCVNNEYVVQFKKGVFELGVPVNPIAIRYNKVFVDGFWNSREQSFQAHLLRLMTSWAVVCDVWFLDPQTIREGETAEQFATRVQHMVAARAGLQAVDWDGYMKYWKPSARLIAARQKSVTDDILTNLGMQDAPDSDSPSPYVSASGAAQHPSARQEEQIGLQDQGVASFPDSDTTMTGLEAAQKHAEKSMQALSKASRLKSAPLSPTLTALPSMKRNISDQSASGEAGSLTDVKLPSLDDAPLNAEEEAPSMDVDESAREGVRQRKRPAA